MKKIVTGGVATRPHLFEAIIKALPHVEIIYALGMSEICGTSSVQKQGDKVGSVGYVLKNVQLKVIDVDTGKTLGPNKVGEFFWKSPYVMTGYYNSPEATRKTLSEDGWLRSGDLGYYDEDGELFVCDRITEAIRFLGHMIYPAEIEKVLQTHPAVREVAIVRLQNDIFEECPLAFVSIFSNQKVSESKLIFCGACFFKRLIIFIQ
ncbi:hypothetical protein P5V15_011248 [Pogonomyrmex californicus]